MLGPKLKNITRWTLLALASAISVLVLLPHSGQCRGMRFRYYVKQRTEIHEVITITADNCVVLASAWGTSTDAAAFQELQDDWPTGITTFDDGDFIDSTVLTTGWKVRSLPSPEVKPGQGLLGIVIGKWLVVSACVLVGLIVIRSLSRSYRWFHPRSSNCGVCGYDLRATPTRCPECGTEQALRRPMN